MTATADVENVDVRVDGVFLTVPQPPPTASEEEFHPELDLLVRVRAASRHSLLNGEWQRQKHTTVQALKVARRSSMKDANAITAVGKVEVREAPEVSTRFSSFSSRFSKFRPSSYHPDAHRANRGGKYFQTIVLSVCLIQLLAIWYAVAIFFPPEWTWNRSLKGLFWTDGAFVRGNGTIPDTVCPKETLCSVGWAEILLLVLSRLTAFVMYVTIGLVFLTKCHSLTHFLSRTYVAELIPIEYLHATHKQQGMLFFVLAVLHTVGHLIRWSLRAELGRMVLKTVGMSGIIAMLLMIVIVAPMAVEALKKRLSFELRISLHAGRMIELLLLATLLAHATRAGLITFSLAGIWMLDKLYMLLFKTYRLETVELTRLDADGEGSNAATGVQMYWRNPDGFNPNSGEYVLVQFPWLEEGGDEWHAFSMYMRCVAAAPTPLNPGSRSRRPLPCSSLFIDARSQTPSCC
jgi:hypothetical protein